MRRSIYQIVYLLATDALLIALAFVLSYYLRFNVMLFIAPATAPQFEAYLQILVFIELVWLAVFQIFNLYAEKRGTLLDEGATVLGAVTVSVLVLLGFLFIYRRLWFSRQVLIYAWVIAFIILTASRAVVDGFKSYLRAKGVGVKKTLIIGAGDIGQALALKIQSNPSLGYRLSGFLDDDHAKIDMEFHGIKVKGPASDIKDLIKKTGAKTVIFAASKMSDLKMLDIITECERLQVEFKIVPGILEIMASRVDTDEIGGVPMVTVSEIRLKGFNAILKRTVDFMSSTFLLLVFSPLLSLVALLIKIESRGPVFFMQERVGQDGKHFMMYKFRSMVADAEKLLHKIEHLSEVEGHIFKMKNDPRLTRVGAFIRKFSIDELPQLINVFRGQMSLVGPRPPLPREVEKYNTWHLKRLRTAPGITGLWQVSGRSTLPFEDMVRLDIYYIENWSLWMDIKIILRTIPTVLFTRGAY